MTLNKIATIGKPTLLPDSTGLLRKLEGGVSRGAELSVLDEAVQHGLLSEIERGLVIKASVSRDEAVKVDDFPSPAPLS